MTNVRHAETQNKEEYETKLRHKKVCLSALFVTTFPAQHLLCCANTTQGAIF